MIGAALGGGADVGSGPLVPFRIVSATTETIRQTQVKASLHGAAPIALGSNLSGALSALTGSSRDGKNIPFRRAFHRGSDYLESARPRTRSLNLEQAQLDSDKI
jgi:hypothetical protein